MIRIPTGPIPAKYARTAAVVFGVGSLVVHQLAPQFIPQLGILGQILTALGITLGDANRPTPVKVPT